MANKPMPLEILAEKGEISSEAVKEMKKFWITNVYQLYCQIKATVNYLVKGVRDKYSSLIKVPEDKFENFLRYIKPYVSEHILNPKSVKKEDYQTRCMFTKEQIDRMKKRLEMMGTEEGYQEVKRQDEIQAMTVDLSYRNWIVENMKENKEFRDWLLNGNSYENFIKQFED